MQICNNHGKEAMSLYRLPVGIAVHCTLYSTFVHLNVTGTSHDGGEVADVLGTDYFKIEPKNVASASELRSAPPLMSEYYRVLRTLSNRYVHAIPRYNILRTFMPTYLLLTVVAS